MQIGMTDAFHASPLHPLLQFLDSFPETVPTTVFWKYLKKDLVHHLSLVLLGSFIKFSIT